MDLLIQKTSLPISILLSILFVFAAANAQRQPVKKIADPVAVSSPPVELAIEENLIEEGLIEENPIEESPIEEPVSQQIATKPFAEPEIVSEPETEVPCITLPPLERFTNLLPSFEVAEITEPIAQQPISSPETRDPVAGPITATLKVPPPAPPQLLSSNSVAQNVCLPQQPLIPVFFYQPPLMVVPLYPVYSVCAVYPVQPAPQPFVTAIVPSSHGAPTFVFSNGVRVKPTFYVPGQPIRNRIRGFAP